MKNLVAFIFALLLMHAPAAFADPHAVFGVFLTAEKNSHIQIRDCGDGSPCGDIVWLNPDTLQPGDTPETAKGKNGNTVMGMRILKGFERKGKDWRSGTIYDPGKDKLYASRIKRLGDNTLEVKGCISFLCQTQIWIPVDG